MWSGECFFMHFCLVVFTCLCICHFCFSSISKHKAKKSHQRKTKRRPVSVSNAATFLFSFIGGSNTDDPCSYCSDNYSTVHVGVYHAVYATWYEHSSKNRNLKLDRVFLLVHGGSHIVQTKNQCYNVAQSLLLRLNVQNLPYIWIFFPFFYVTTLCFTKYIAGVQWKWSFS